MAVYVANILINQGADFSQTYTLEDTNSKLDASQEFAKKVGADVMMNARVERRGTAKISDKQKRINKAAETFIRYLTNQLPEGKWNDYMGKDYVKYAFRNGYLDFTDIFNINFCLNYNLEN